ncbi:hypothetical protein NQ317_004202 [Molorchus minor]|uniref:CCHC-type domain-containing protein n=1 Tax=Molorchus minor TaxID=1323400 RepID=A0ABQ9IX43_9CUCU|nr:hypothetical protein NQ317_004202 [Molorchus minor]
MYADSAELAVRTQTGDADYKILRKLLSFMFTWDYFNQWCIVEGPRQARTRKFAKLNKDELLYELHVRGFEEVRGETAASMRRKLGEVLANDAFGQLIVSETFQPVVLEEIKAVLNKIESLELRVPLQRLKIQDTEENKPTLRAVDNLLERLDKIEESVDRKIEESRCQVFAAINQPSTSDQLVDPNVTVTTPIVPHVVNNIYKSRCEPRKWGISFSGDGVSSISSFLEQVEERRLASNIPEGDLLASVVDLFTGECANHCRFREEFQPFDYEDELRQEIRNRRQGPDESIGIYFACMKNLFSRLITKLEEKEKLTLLRRNLLPYFIHNLGLVEYTKVDELLGLCKKLEINKLTAERCHPTPSGNLLEPDLSQPAGTTDRRVRPLMKQDMNRLRVATVEETKCWNCSRSGHRFRDCRAPRHVFCFGCGADNVVKRNCSKCSRGREWFGKRQRRRYRRATSSNKPVPVDLSWKVWLDFVEEEYRQCRVQSKFTEVFGDPRPYVTVNIFGKNFTCLLDSGATRCIVGNKGLQVLRDLGVKIDKSQAGSVTTANNGASCDTIGSVNLPIRLEGKLRVFDCLVVPNIPKEIILGIDFWKEMELVPNFNTGGWNFPDVECCLIDKQSLSDRDHAELREVVDKYFSAMGTSEATHRHMQEMTDVQESVRNRLRTAYQNNAGRYNLRRRDVSFVVGDFVWRRNHVLSDAGNYFSAKLAPKFLKSRVVQKMSRNVYRLEDCRSGRVVGDYYVSDLKPFNE